MKLQGAFQEALVALLCFDVDKGAEAAAILQPKDFDPVYREVAELALQYRQRHKQPPGEHTVDLFDTAKANNDKMEVAFDTLLKSIEVVHKEINASFIMERVKVFVRYQRLKTGMATALRELSKEDADGLVAAEATLTKALRATDSAFKLGFEFANDLDASTAFLTAPSEAVPTGIPEFDKHGLGPKRGQLHLLMAPYGRGKSWWLIHLAAEAKKHGKNVLYVSMEMSGDDIAQRLVQRCLAVPKRKTDMIKWLKFVETTDPADRGLRTKEVKFPAKMSFDDDRAERHVREKLRVLQNQGRILICDFPQGSLSTDGLENFMNIAAERSKFIPDLVLVDYADIMKHEKDARWEASIQIGEGLRRIAQTWKTALASVTQVTSEGLKAKRVDVQHLANARGNFGTADTVFTYSQSDSERELGLARLFVAKARMDMDRFTVLISQSYATGRFVCDSVRMGSNYHTDDKEE